ncbi:MAG: cation:proton antiporter [Balneolaceae bacterium]|nr:cation:proton antiporter [Balneolaceae bacterium]
MILGVGLPFLNELVALFLVSVGIAYLCYRLKLVPIVGFLIAGVLIGPNALAVVPDQELVDILAEIGVILLLFTIGIEFSLEKLNRIRKAIVIGGGMQVLVTAGAVTGLLAAFGVDLNSGIYTGFLVALSSTAIVLGLLSQRRETDTPAGQLSLAVLIFQDLAIIVMVLLVPILAGQSDSGLDVLWILGKAILLIALVIVLARRIVPWILEKVAKTRKQELFLLTVVAICFGTAALTAVANVSLALGAFLAGLVVSESHFSEQALSEILPLRTIFNAVFFVSVGMLLDISYVLDYPLILLGTAAAVIMLKLLITSASLLSLGYPVRIAAASGLALAQIGEFSFVLERAGRVAGITPAGMGEMGSQTFIAVSVLLMILTPFQLKFASGFGNILSRTPLRHLGQDSELPDPGEQSSLEDHVIIVGYGPAGRRLVTVLRETGIPFVVIEMNPDSVDEMRQQQIPAIYGDASSRHILEMADIEKAKLCVIAINDPSASPRIIKAAHYQNPTLQIIVRTRYLTEVEMLENAGADIVIPEEMETTVRIFSQVLGAYMIPEQEIEQQIRTLRAEDYKILRGSIQEAHLMVLQGLDEEGLHTRAVAVRRGSPAAHNTLRELQLRNRYDLSVLAVRRGTKTIGNPDGDFVVEPGDRLVLVGTADQFVASADLFREEPSTN